MLHIQIRNSLGIRIIYLMHSTRAHALLLHTRIRLQTPKYSDPISHVALRLQYNEIVKKMVLFTLMESFFLCHACEIIKES